MPRVRLAHRLRWDGVAARLAVPFAPRGTADPIRQQQPRCTLPRRADPRPRGAPVMGILFGGEQARACNYVDRCSS